MDSRTHAHTHMYTRTHAHKSTHLHKYRAPATQSEYRTKPSHFVSHLVGHEGPGSLLSVLKGLGWATELSAGPGTTLPNESLFSVTIRLTEEVREIRVRDTERQTATKTVTETESVTETETACAR